MCGLLNIYLSTSQRSRNLLIANFSESQTIGSVFTLLPDSSSKWRMEQVWSSILSIRWTQAEGKSFTFKLYATTKHHLVSKSSGKTVSKFSCWRTGTWRKYYRARGNTEPFRPNIKPEWLSASLNTETTQYLSSLTTNNNNKKKERLFSLKYKYVAFMTDYLRFYSMTACKSFW